MAESRKYQVCFGVGCAYAKRQRTRTICQKILGTARAPRLQECLKIGSIGGLPQLGEKRAKFPRFVFEPVQGCTPIVIEGGVAGIAPRRFVEPAVRMSPAMLSRTGSARPEKAAAQQERARHRRDRNKE